MSKARKPRRGRWQPWTAPASSPGDERAPDVVQGSIDAGVLAAARALHKAGATSIEYGFDPPEGYEGQTALTAGVPVVWWFRVTFGGGPGQSDRVEEGRAGPTADYGFGILEAAASILRRCGSAVTIVDGR